MPNAAQQNVSEDNSLTCHSFTLVLSGIDQLDDRVEDAIYEAGCDDALLTMRAGSAMLMFDRESSSLAEAIQSAIQDVENSGLGVQVERVVLPGSEVMEAFNQFLSARRILLEGSGGNMPGTLLESLNKQMGNIPQTRDPSA